MTKKHLFSSISLLVSRKLKIFRWVQEKAVEKWRYDEDEGNMTRK